MTFQSQPRPGVAIGDDVLDLQAVKSLFVGPLMSKNSHVFDNVSKHDRVIHILSFCICILGKVDENNI